MRLPFFGISWNKLSMWVLGVGGIVLLGWQLWFVNFGQPIDTMHTYSNKTPPELIGILLPEPQKLRPFSLIDQDKTPFNPDRVAGKWTFLFFGYTHCPDVCPTAMGLLAEVFSLLKPHPNGLQSVQGVFVTVDPERDTPQQLKEYLPFFHPDFLGLTGTKEAIQSFSKQLNVYYATTTLTDTTEPTISHSSTFFLLDPQGRFTALFQPERHQPAVMADLFIKIRQNYGDLP